MADGCLSIYLPAGALVQTNLLSAVITPPTGDDVTGMVWLQPFNGRKIMYVIEGGELLLYDNTFANVVCGRRRHEYRHRHHRSGV